MRWGGGVDCYGGVEFGVNEVVQGLLGHCLHYEAQHDHAQVAVAGGRGGGVPQLVSYNELHHLLTRGGWGCA